MAVLAFEPTPFFREKNRAFWRLQFAGWGGAMMLRAMSALAGGQDASFLVIVLIFTVTGFSLSLILSVIYRQLIQRRPLVTWGTTGIVLTLAVCLYAFIDSWVIGLYRPDSETAFTTLFLGFFFFDLVLLGAYSALYYAINFFLQVEEQADRLGRLEAQATGAQLAMLRYQLNPHFLFNTLNSISTLVLLKQTEPANAMLTRLSAFLRQTLVNEPTAKVTVAQEVETLKLYLGIERMRFEDRLRTDFRIQPDAADACLPSMLLQPLVENAIKYAVSAQEEGAKITISARIVGERMIVTVGDTGPGLPGGVSAGELPGTSGSDERSTGVGLANIRDRLQQAYGEDHRFEIRAPADGGFSVIIELPHDPLPAEQQTPASQNAAKQLVQDQRASAQPTPSSTETGNPQPIGQRA